MKKEALEITRKAAKIAGVTCVAAGAIAIVTSGAALVAIAEGAKYVTNSIQTILKETAKDAAIFDPEPVTEEAKA